MKILHVLDHSIPLHSGYTFRTRAILREQHRLGWGTVQLTSPRQGLATSLEDAVDGLRFLRTPFRPGVLSRIPGLWPFDEMMATRRRLDDVVRIERPDIIHAHSPVLNAWPAILCGRAHKIPVVYEVRAFWEDAAVDHGSTREGSFRYRLTQQLETLALARSDAVTTICEGLKLEMIGRGIDAAKITTIPNAVDVERFAWLDSRDAELESALNLAGRLVVGFCGSFYAYEGLDLLIRAMPLLLRHAPNVSLLLVGGGPQERALRNLAEQSGLGEAVVFVGRVPNEEVNRYYSLIDVLAFPRRKMRLTELVTPLKPLEAMAQGRVVAASDVGGHRELIEHGRNGLLFPADDVDSIAGCLMSALSDSALRSRLTGAGRAFVEQERTWAASVARYVPIYEGLIRQSIIA